MSYILEGLKKLERKRRKEETPKGFLFSPEEEIFSNRKKSHRPLMILAAALFLNAAVLTWWFMPRHPLVSGDKKEVPSATPVPAEPIKKVEAKRPTEKGALPEPTTMKMEKQREKPAPTARMEEGERSSHTPVLPSQPPSLAEKSPPIMEGPPVKVGDLPSEVKQKLPPLKMSLHYYSSDPGARFVVIDQRNLREGDTLAEDLKVVEINPQGAVLQYRKYRVFLSWQEGL